LSTEYAELELSFQAVRQRIQFLQQEEKSVRSTGKCAHEFHLKRSLIDYAMRLGFFKTAG
jgi:hypothetical protein